MTSDRARARASALLRNHNGPKPGDLVEAAAVRLLIVAADVLGVRTQRGQWWLPGQIRTK